MLVPGCPPGLFTKQFVEFAPSQINAANIFSHGHAGDHADVHDGANTGCPRGEPGTSTIGSHPRPRSRRSPRRPCRSCRSRRPRDERGGGSSARTLADGHAVPTSELDHSLDCPAGRHMTITTPSSPTRSPTWWTSSSTPGPRASTIRRAAAALDPGSPTNDRQCRHPGRGRPRRRRLVQDVRVLRGAQPDERLDRAGRPGGQLRLGAAGHQAGPDEPQPDRRRGGVLRRLRPAEFGSGFNPDPAQLDRAAAAPASTPTDQLVSPYALPLSTGHRQQPAPRRSR